MPWFGALVVADAASCGVDTEAIFAVRKSTPRQAVVFIGGTYAYPTIRTLDDACCRTLVVAGSARGGVLAESLRTVDVCVPVSTSEFIRYATSDLS